MSRSAHTSAMRIPAQALLRLARYATLAALLAAVLWIAAGEGANPVSAATPLRQIEVGLNHACALDTGGRITCWGDDSAGQVSDWGRYRYRTQRFTSVSAGSFLTCGIKTNNSVMCWGYPERENGTHNESVNEDWSAWDNRTGYTGWVNTPPESVKFKSDSISVGNYHACAIRTSGVLACWGKAGSDRLVIPTDSGSTITDWIKVEAGFANACGIRQGGSVVCFGRSTYKRSDGPSGAGPFVDVTLGVYNGCALARNGSVECWGGDTISVLDPVKVPPVGVAFTEIEMATAGAYYYTCGLDRGGRVHCWGVNVQPPPSGVWSKLSVGGPNICALTSGGHLGCSGESDGGLFSPPSGQFRQTDGGQDFSCAIRTDNTIACWGGGNGSGQLNAPSGSFTMVATGANHACAIKTDNTIACWGGVTGGNTHAKAVAPAGAFTYVSAGLDLTCGVRSDRSLHCWGASTHNRQTEPGGSFTHVAVGASHVCAIKSDKSVACWGEASFFDREGDGTADDIGGKGNHTSTIPPSGSHQYTHISAAEGHTCAIRTDKKAVCWGYHADSRFAVPGWGSDPQGFGNINYTAIATGGQPNCAIRESNGALSCWNTEKSQYLPGSSILAMRGLKSLGAGSYHSCAIDSGDGLVCWGAGNVIPFPARYAAPPPAPARLSADSGDLEVTLSWSDTPRATGWEYQYKTTGGYGIWRSTGSRATSYTVTGLRNGTEYTFRVRGVNLNGKGEPSPPAVGTPYPKPVPRPNDATFRLEAGPGGGMVTLSWDRVAQATGYQYLGNAGGWVWRDVTPSASGNRLSYTLTGLHAWQTYVFWLRSVREGADPSTGTNARRIKPRPTAPGLSAEAGDGQVTLHWSGAHGSRSWKYRRDGGAWQTIHGSYDETSSHTVTGLANGRSYRFQVLGVNEWGDGDPSAGVSATPREPPPLPPGTGPPAAPANLGARDDFGAIALSWDAVDGATGYQYRISDSNPAEDGDAWEWPSGETVDVTGTADTVHFPGYPGQWWYFEVRAVRTAGGETVYGEWSGTIRYWW